MNKATSVDNKISYRTNFLEPPILKKWKENHEQLHTEIFQNAEKQPITGTKNEDNGAIMPKFKKNAEAQKEINSDINRSIWASGRQESFSKNERLTGLMKDRGESISMVKKSRLLLKLIEEVEIGLIEFRT